jgi:hypothetical protein
MKFKTFTATTALAVMVGGFIAAESKAATIFVNSDEWTFSNSGFALAPAGSTANFVNNLVGEMGPKIHAYSTNFGFTESNLATAMSNAGATYSTGTGFAFTLENISEYDAIFLGGFALDANGITALSAYVAAGGNVYVAGGTGAAMGGDVAEAAAWNTFLSPFGVQMGAPYNGISGSIAVSGDALFDGVDGLYQNNGNPLSGPSVFCCGQDGLFAVYRTDDNGGGPGPNPIPLPAAGWLLLGGVTSLAAVRRRRKA